LQDACSSFQLELAQAESACKAQEAALNAAAAKAKQTEAWAVLLAQVGAVYEVYVLLAQVGAVCVCAFGPGRGCV